jgi:hypothetical protein
MEPLKRYTEDLTTIPCRYCYCLLLLMKTAIIVYIIKFMLFFRILTDQKHIYPTLKKLKKAIKNFLFGYYYRRYYYIYRKNQNYFDF